jgi:hypothetical protein
MKMLLRLSLALSASLAPFSTRAADAAPAEKPNRVERSLTNAGKTMERAGDRAAKSATKGMNSAGEWTGRKVDKAGKAVGRAADNTTNWVKKKTE